MTACEVAWAVILAAGVVVVMLTTVAWLGVTWRMLFGP